MEIEMKKIDREIMNSSVEGGKREFILFSEELGEEFRSESVAKVYKEWRRLVEDDKENHDKKTYYFELAETFENEPGTEYRHMIKIYRRKNKIFWRGI